MPYVKKFLAFSAVSALLLGGWLLMRETDHGIVAAKKAPDDTAMFMFDRTIPSLYRLKFVQNSLLKQGDLIAADLNMRYDIDAVLNMRVLEKNGDTLWLAFQLSDFKLSSENVAAGMLSMLKRYYTAMFLVEVDPDGQIRQIRFPGLKENFAGLEQMMYLLEVITRESKNYRIDQDDNIGTYRAFYQKNGRDLKKQKQRYVQVVTPDPRYKAIIQTFQLDAEIDDGGNWLDTLHLNETVHIRNAKNAMFAQNTNTVELAKTDKAIDTTLDIWQEDQNIAYILSAFDELAQYDTNIFEHIAQEAAKKRFIDSQTTVEKLLSRIQKANTPADFFELGQFITLFPDSAYALKDIINGDDDTVSMRLIAVLASAGTPQAQTVLSELAAGGAPKHDNRLRSVVALGDVEVPTPEAIDALVDLSAVRGDEEMDDLSNTALLSIGRNADKSPDYREHSHQHIREQYQSAASLDREKNSLYAMQNAGAENFLNEIDASLQSNSTKVRMLAIRTIATIDDKMLRKSLLEEQLQKQQSPQVKETIRQLLDK